MEEEVDQVIIYVDSNSHVSDSEDADTALEGHRIDGHCRRIKNVCVI